MSVQKSRHVRIAADLADKIAKIVEVCDEQTADYLDPILRPVIEADYERVSPAIEAISAAKAGAQAAKSAPASA